MYTALSFAKRQLSIELNSAHTNRMVHLETERVIRAANFEGLPLAQALDFARIALASTLTTAAERAVKLLQRPHSGLPDGLAERAGIYEDGLAEFDRVLYALASEARVLAYPVSFELSGTSLCEGIEDRMSMAPLAARRLAEMVDFGERIVAIELVIAAQAVELRALPRLGDATARAFQLVRERVPFTHEGEALPPDLEPVKEIIHSGRIA